MSDFDLTEYLARKDGTFSLPPDDLGYRTPKQREVSSASAEKMANLQKAVDRQIEVLDHNSKSLVGRLDLDPDSVIGTVVNHMAATVNTGVGIASKALTAPLDYLANSAEQSVSDTQRVTAPTAEPAQTNRPDTSLLELHEYPDPVSGRTLLLNNFDGDVPISRLEAIDLYKAGKQNAVLEKSPAIAESMKAQRAALDASVANRPEENAFSAAYNFGGEHPVQDAPAPVTATDSRSVDRLQAAMKTRALSQSIKDATNLDSLVAIDPETGKVTSGLQQRVVGDAALKLASGFVGADESLVGLASLVSGGEAGKALEDAGYSFKETKKQLAGMMTPEQQLADSKTANAQGFTDTLDAALTNPSTIGGGIIESVPSMWLGGTAGKLLTKAAPAIKAGIAGAFGEGLTMAGQQAENIRNQSDDKRLSLKQSLLAVGTGVMGAAVGVLGNKAAHALKVSDVDEALVNGALQDAKRGGPARTLLAGGIEGGEELVQSSGEQVAQNVALDKPYDEGVGNAAAMGLVTGAPMGGATAALEHAGEKASKLTSEQKQVAQFQDAVDKADPAPYLDKTDTTNYAPDKAVAVLLGASQKEDATPETKAEHLDKAEQIVSDVNADIVGLKATIADTTPEGQAKLAAEIVQAKDNGNTDLASALEDGLKVAQATTPKQVEQLTATLNKLEGSLDTAKQVTEQLGVLVSPKAEEVTAQIQAAATEPAAAQKVVTFAMNHPDSLSQADLTGLVNDDSNALTTEQRSYLKQFDAARLARNALQTVRDVNHEVTVGTDENMGLAKYQTAMSHALATNNQPKQAQLMTQLQAFAEGHQDKYRTFRAAYDEARDTQQPVQVIRTQKGWEINRGTLLTPTELKANTGKDIRAGKYSRPLVQNIQSEAKAIVATLKEFQAAQALASVSPAKVAPVKAAKAPAVQAPVDAPLTDEGTTPSAKAEEVAPTSELSAPASEQSVTEPGVEATAATSETEATAAPAAAAASEAEPAQETGQLAVFQGERAAKVDSSNYRTVNGLTQFFTQAKDATVDGLNRPLVAVKNFMSQTVHTLADFAPFKTLNSQQDQVLTILKDAHKAWSGAITALLPSKRSGDYAYKNPIEFFIDPETGDLPENVKTAITVAVLGWANEHGRDLPGTRKHITRMLGWDKDAYIPGEVYEILGELGQRESLVANDLGQTIMQVLGIKARPEAGQNERARIQAGIGQFAIALMLDQKLVERQEITKGQLQAIGSQAEDNASEEMTAEQLDAPAEDLTEEEQAAAKKAKQDALTPVFFLRVNFADADTKASVDELMAATLGSQNILDKLFGTGRRPSEPSRVAPEFTQEFTQNTDQPTPKDLAETLNQLTKKVWHPIKDTFDVLKQMPEDLLHAMMGVVPVDEKLIHKDNRLGLKAKNDALIREKELAFAYLDGLASEDPQMQQELFMEYSIWKNHRVGMTGNILNPQASKVHRWLVGMAEWNTTIDPKHRQQMDRFLLQVAAGLDIPIDKQFKRTSLKQLRELLATDVMQSGLSAISQALAGETLQDFEKEAIKVAVGQGKQNLHSFAALKEIVKYQQAKADGTTFESNLMGEVDGVTNGPMLSQILFGTISQFIAEKGGFYAKGALASDYPSWRGIGGHQDFYETLATGLSHNLKLMFKAETLKPIFAITGDLTVKVDRNIVKRPLTAVNYGSTLFAAIDGMADEFIEKLYKNFEALAKEPDAALAEQKLNGLLVAVSDLLESQNQSRIDATADLAAMMDTVLSAKQAMGLKQAFKDSVGEAMKASLKDSLGSFMTARDTYNTYGRLAYDLYATVYQHLRNSFIEQNLEQDGKPGLIAGTAHKGVQTPIQDLTQEQEALIQQRLGHMDPVLASGISSRDKGTATGMRLISSAKALEDQPAYSGQLKLGQKVPSVGRNERVQTMRFRGFMRKFAGPGVSSLVNGVQSTDSAIMSAVYKALAILNIHDAGGAGINKLGEMAIALNQSTFDNLLRYSPVSAMADTLEQVTTGLAEVLKGEQGNELAAAVRQVLNQYGHSDTRSLLQQARQFAYQADKAKLEFLAQQEHVSQYGLADYSYSVTEANQQEAQAAADKLTKELSPELEQALLELDQSLQAKAPGLKGKQSKAEQDRELMQKLEAPTPFGKLGSATIQSDPLLVEAFEKGQIKTAQDLFGLLDRRLQVNADQPSLISRKLLKLLAKTVKPGLPVRYVTALSNNVHDQQGLDHARGWFTTISGTAEIYVKAPEFVQSGLTAELMLHELVHSVVVDVVSQAEQGKGDKDTQALVKDLESLLTVAKAKVESSTALQEQFGEAVSNVQELISWGMTNKAFQEQVLQQVSSKSKTTGNRLVTGMKAFIDALVGLAFRNADANRRDVATNGLTVLFHNVSGLFAASQEQSSSSDPVTLAMNANDPLAQIQRLSTVELLDHLSGPGMAHSTHLRQLQVSVANKLHGPFGVIKDAVAAAQALTVQDRFLKAVASGTLPYTAKAQLSGVALSQQESFLFEQVEAIMQASTAETGVTSVAYRELRKLYEEAKAKVTPADVGQAAWDFTFLAEQGTDHKSDYLARFAAMGLAHEGMAKALQFSTKLDERALNGMSFWEKVQAMFERVLETLHSRLTHTKPGQIADSKLLTLVDQLVDIEAKRRTLLANPRTGINAVFEAQTRKLSDAVRKGLTTAANSKLLRENGNSAVRAASGLASTVFGDRMDHFVTGVQKLRDQQFKQLPGLAMGIFNELRGSHAGNLTAHELLRATNLNEQVRKQLITNTTNLLLDSYANAGQDLSKEQKEAITQGALRADLQSLIDHYSMDELEQLLSDPAKLQSAIATHTAQLKRLVNFRFNLAQAKFLGYYMATGINRSPKLAKNVKAIAEVFGTRALGTVNAQDSKAAQAVLDPLVSLLALQYTDATVLKNLAQVFRTENARGNESGMQLTLRMHRQLQQDARERLFDGSEGLMLKGYVPEVFNPHITLVAADGTQGRQLMRMGYEKSLVALEQDKADPYAEETHLYRLEDGGLKAYVTGIYSTTGMHAKGSTVHGGEFDMQNQTLHAQNQRHSALIERRKAAATAALFTTSESMDPRRERGNHLAPVYNPAGEAVNYAYLMTHQTKDVALERNNKFEELLGKMAGATFDKEASAVQNRRAVQAMHDQYTEEYSKMPERYLVVGPASTIPSLQEAYKLLPKSTQQAIQDIWGSPNMLVRSDLADMYFGYRKLSLTDPFKKQRQPEPGTEGIPGKAMRSAKEQIFIDFWSYFLADKSGRYDLVDDTRVEQRERAEATAALRLRRAEDVWQEIVSEIKDILVVKSGLTLLGNIMSNFSELYWIGVPLMDIVKHHRVALRGVVAYRKDSKELFKLQQLLATNTLQGSQQDMQQRMIQLEDSIARSPVKELIDAGLLPTIVEDVAQEHDDFSYKTKLAKKTENITKQINPHIRNIGRQVLMSHGTGLYDFMSQSTQISDFLARYTAFHHMTERETAPMDKKTAVQFVSDAFVNYDVPTHRSMQYLNDMGIIWFTKYYLRIQKVIMHLWRDNPARAIMLMGIDHFFSGAQTLLDSGFLHHINNPLSIGALKYPGSLDEIATINAMLSPFGLTSSASWPGQ